MIPSSHTDATRLTCVIPAYNNLELFSRALVSAISQCDVAFDVVVTDDSTTDDVRNFTTGIAALYPHVRWVAGPRSGNPVANWNNGLAHARGDYVVVLHHDEFLVDRSYFSDAVTALDRDGTAAIAARSKIVTLRGKSRFGSMQWLAIGLGLPLWTLNAINWIGSTACVTFRRGPLFDESLVNTVDAEFYGRVFAKNPVAFLDNVRVISVARHREQLTDAIDVPRISCQELVTHPRNDLAPSAKTLLVMFWRARIGFR